MKQPIKITKHIPEISTFELKVPCEQTDDFGNKVTMYRKESVNLQQLDREIEMFETQILKLQESLNILQEKKNLIIN